MTSPEIDICHCNALRKASRHVSQYYDLVLREFGLSANQYAILKALERVGGHSGLQELSVRMVLERSALARNLRLLERDGWLTMTEAPLDRRERLIVLSAAGRNGLAAAQPAWQHAQERFIGEVGAQNSAELRRILALAKSAELIAT